MIPAVFGTHVAAATRPLSVWVASRDVTALILADGFEIEDAGASQGGLAATLNETLANLPELTDQAYVRVFDESQATEMFRGFLKSRKPTLVPAWTNTSLRATDHGELLDAYIPGPYSRPAESDAARIGYFWGLFASPYLSGDLSSVAVVNATLPAQVFQGVTLRRVIDMIAAQASASAEWYLDQTGHLHYFSSETNAAPKNITSDTPAGDEVAPLDLEIDYDTMTYANAVYVNGQNATGSGWVYDHAEIARIGTTVTASLDAPDCTTVAMRDALGAMYLGRLAGSTARGSFTVTSEDADGWRAGQTLDVRSADVGIDQNFRLSRVRTTQLKPSTYLYACEFGGSRRGSSGGAGGSDGIGTGGTVVYGELGGDSNTYVTSEGVAVTDGTNLRVELGKVDDDYGLRVTSADGTTVIIDGTSNMFKILATGTFSGSGNDLTQTDLATVTLTGLGTFATTPGHISYVSPANDTAANQQLGTYLPANSNSWVASSSGGATTAAGVTLQYVSYIKTHLDGSNQCMVIMTMVNHSGSSQTNYGRYYVLAEAAL